MTRILDYTGNSQERTTTVAELRTLRAGGRQLTQTTASSAHEAAAAEAAGIDMIACLGHAVDEVRQGTSKLFVSAAIDFQGAVTPYDLLRDAFAALEAGADAVITARGLDCVRTLVADDLPVMGHLGFIPKKATLYGGVRSVGKTAAEARTLWADMQALEDAGAFAVECELVPANLMAEIRKRTSLVTVSLGSGPDADVMFLFQNDVCGEGPFKPRHARAYADLNALHAQIQSERIRALGEWRADVASHNFPVASEVNQTPPDELAAFLNDLD